MIDIFEARLSGIKMGKDKNALSANWGANLLVKDRLSGKLKRLRFKNHPDGPKELLGEEEDEEKEKLFGVETTDSVLSGPNLLKSAPIQDHFMPVNLAGASAGDKAQLFFHPDDKQQLEEIAKNMPSDDSKKYDLEKIVDTLTAKQHLDFDEANKGKFSDIIFDFFRNRKRFLTVREILLADVKTRQGGLNDKAVDAVLSVVKSLKVKIEAAGGLVVKLSELPVIQIPAADSGPIKAPAEAKAEALKKFIEADIDHSQAERPQEEIAEALKEINLSEDKPIPAIKVIEAMATPAVPSAIPVMPASVKLPLAAGPKAGFQIPTTEPMPSIRVNRPTTEQSNLKKPVTDVLSKTGPILRDISQARHVLTGPIGELEAMTLDNFRRLGESNEERAERLLDKIRVLEHDSFTRKTQGIEAWRRSETHQLYLQLGLESMQTGQDVKQIISQREKEGKQTLSPEEFAIISDLNKKLRF